MPRAVRIATSFGRLDCATSRFCSASPVLPAPIWVRASSSSTSGSFGRRRFASFSACSARENCPMPA